MDLSKEKYIVPTDSHCRNGHHLSHLDWFVELQTANSQAVQLL